MAQKLKQKLQLQAREAGVIDGFCYPYARLLLDKAIEMGDQIWQEGPGRPMITDVAFSILDAISKQIGTSLSSMPLKQDVEKLITDAKEFLAIFED